MLDANRLFFFQEMIVSKWKRNGIIRKPLVICVEFLLPYEDALNCKILRSNQGSIFASLCSYLIDGKDNYRSNWLCRTFWYIKHVFGTILPGNIWIFKDPYAFHWQQVFQKKVYEHIFGLLCNADSGGFRLQTSVGNTLPFSYFLFAVIQHNFTKWGLYICIDLEIAHIGSWLFNHNKNLCLWLLC